MNEYEFKMTGEVPATVWWYGMVVLFLKQEMAIYLEKWEIVTFLLFI